VGPAYANLQWRCYGAGVGEDKHNHRRLAREAMTTKTSTSRPAFEPKKRPSTGAEATY
jgi:hypothetical protein